MKHWFIIFIIVGYGLKLSGQTLTFTLGSDSGFSGDTVVIPIVVDSFSTISGYQGTLRWDSTVLHFLEITSPTPGVLNTFGKPGVNIIPFDAATFSWVDFAGIGQNIPLGSTVIELRFVIKANAPTGVYPVVMNSSITLLGFSANSPLSPPIVYQGSVTVLNPVAPFAICQNLNLYLDSMGQGMISPTDLDDGSTVQTGTPILGISQDSFDCSDVGVHQVKLYISDENGTKDSCTALVTVLDTLAPIMVCQDLAITLDSTGMAVIDASMIDNGSNDACGIQSLTLSQDTFGIADIGEQNITLIAIDGSGNMDSCVAKVTVDNTTSIEDEFSNQIINSLQIFPNPATEVINLHWDNSWYGPVSLSILTQLGQEIYRETRNKNTHLMQVSLEVNHLPTGIYLIQIKQDSYVQYAKMIKQ